MLLREDEDTDDRVDFVPGLGAALWPVTFIVLQVIDNVYFWRAGFWRIPARRGLTLGAIRRAGPSGSPLRRRLPALTPLENTALSSHQGGSVLA